MYKYKFSISKLNREEEIYLQLYVLDRSKNVLATTAGFYNDLHHKELTAGASTFVFDLNKSDEAAQYMVSGNIITMLDDQEQPWSFEILYYDEYQTYKTVHCEDVGINLFNKACDVWYYTDAKLFVDYFNVITDGTPWELGVNQLTDLSRTLTFTGRDTGLGRLLSVLKAFDNAECIFNIQMNGPVPVKYVIDVYKKIGTIQDNIQIAYNEELDNIRKTETRQEFVTALAGVGSVIEDTETDADGSIVDTNKPQEYVDFIDLEYDDGDFYTTKGDKFLRARTANSQFNPGDQGFIEDFYEYDTASNTELFNRTLTQIQTRSKPQFTYDAQVKVIDPNLDIGDTVTIIDYDYNPALYLQARVATLEKSYTDTTKGSITFTNYVVLTDTVTQQIAALRNKVNGIKNGKTTYVWIRYADDDKGHGMSSSPYGKEYVAIVPKTNQPVPSDDPDDYAGQWALIQGANGKNGDDAHVHMAYANSVDGKTDFTTDQNQAHNCDYLGTYSDNSSAQSTNPSDYTWQLIRGRQGETGQPGSKDVPVVTVNSVAPTSPKNGDLWYQTMIDADGTRIVGFTVYNNGKWEPSKIDQSVLVVTKLVSVEIDSATINSPDITVPFDYFDEELNEYKGSMEFKNGIMRHVSTTVADGTMLRTLIKPTGYTLDAYQSEQDFKNENPYIHTEVYADNISVSNKISEKSGSISSDGVGGSINDGSDNSIGIGLTWSDMQKYLPEMGQNGSKRAFNWFDIISGMASHPNLLKNSSFKDGLNNWENSSGWFTYGNDRGLHQGNVVAISHGNNSNLWLGQMVFNVIKNQKLSYSFWLFQEGDKNTDGGIELRFENDDASSTSTFKYAIESTIPNNEWAYVEMLPVISPDWATRVHFAFYNRNSQSMLVAQPMLCYGDHVWPYQPT